MKELKLVVSESDSSSLVLTSASITESEEFYLPVTQQLRDIIAGLPVTDAPPSDALGVVSINNDAESTKDEAGVDTDSTAEESSSEAAEASAAEAKPQLTAVSSPEDNAAGSAATTANTPAAAGTSSRPRRTHLSIRPRAIQERIRQGASIAELAEEADTDESTIEPYAWPILQERALVADNAHSAHPIVEAEGGPSKQTLWEVLATALAARGESLSDCEWDAYQEASRRWIVTVSWNKSTAGQTSSHVAEFSYDRRQGEPQIVEPHNSLAADLVDPRYGRPVRSISAVAPLISDTTGDEDEDIDYAAELDEPGPESYAEAAKRSAQRTNSRETGDQDAEGQDAEDTQNLRAIRDEDLLQNPPAQAQERTPKKRRKAVTPHWEDVLLGVRTNPKKK